jgi:hypothetical protein
MQATDSRLDRLGRRHPAPEDLADPVFSALAGLAHEVDVVDPSQDAAVARLLEVLDGRPLWVLDGEDLSDTDGTQDMILLDDPAWESGRQVIDLRQSDAGAPPRAGAEPVSAEPAGAEPGAEDGAGADEPGDVAAADETPQAAAESGDPTADADAESEADSDARSDAAAEADEVRPAPPTVPIAKPAVPPAPPAEPGSDDDVPDADQGAGLPAAARVADDEGDVAGAGRPLRLLPGRPREGEPAWERAIRRATLPAAAAIAIFTIGGGVTAALTGDPMAPLTGVSRVVDSINGDSGEQRTTYAALQQNLEKAQGALASGDVEAAQALVQSARERLADVPPAEQAKLRRQILDVQKAIAATKAPTSAPAPSSPATRAPSSNPSSPASPEPSNTSAPEPTDDPTPTEEPSAQPSETADPTDTPTEEPSVASSPASGGDATSGG